MTLFHSVFYISFSIFNLISFLGFTQFINPSFEGGIATSTNPIGWKSCNNYATPDIQPGGWNVNTPPSHGNTYISLVARGNDGNTNSNHTEDVTTYVEGFLVQNECYQLSLDLAYSNTFDDGIRSLNKPLILKIWAGDALCNKQELLIKSIPIDHTDWRQYKFSLVPKLGTYTNLFLEAFYVELPTYYGNILIDNAQWIHFASKDESISLDTVVEGGSNINLEASVPGLKYHWTPSEGLSCDNCFSPIAWINKSVTYTVTIENENGCSFDEIFVFNIPMKIPNIFTPNGDGINDLFSIEGLPNPGTKIQIYNRWGKAVYKSDNYNNQWRGNSLGVDLADGVYYYQMKNEEFSIDTLGFVNIRR